MFQSTHHTRCDFQNISDAHPFRVSIHASYKMRLKEVNNILKKRCFNPRIIQDATYNSPNSCDSITVSIHASYKMRHEVFDSFFINKWFQSTHHTRCDGDPMWKRIKELRFNPRIIQDATIVWSLHNEPANRFNPRIIQDATWHTHAHMQVLTRFNPRIIQDATRGERTLKSTRIVSIHASYKMRL